jgi:hypothetical protein
VPLEWLQTTNAQINLKVNSINDAPIISGLNTNGVEDVAYVIALASDIISDGCCVINRINR